MTTPPTRWELNRIRGSSQWQVYADKFARYHADGVDLDGEARFVDVMVARGSTVLDAGCGTGRVTAALAGKGHRAIGVDKDAALVQIGLGRYPGVSLLVYDLAVLTGRVFGAQDLPESFDLIVCPGNVMVYLAPGTERRVLTNLASLLRPGGRAVFGFATGRDYTVEGLDTDAEAVGWTREHRFGSWHLDPFVGDSDWAVSVFRAPETADQATGPGGRPLR